MMYQQDRDRAERPRFSACRNRAECPHFSVYRDCADCTLDCIWQGNSPLTLHEQHSSPHRKKRIHLASTQISERRPSQRFYHQLLLLLYGMAEYHQQPLDNEKLILPDLVLLHEKYLTEDHTSTTLSSRVENLDGWLDIKRPSYHPERISQELSRVQARCGIDREGRELSNAGIAVYFRLCTSPHNKTHANQIKAAVQRREALRYSCGSISEDWIGALLCRDKFIITSLIAV
jgi:hypothetical protein